MMARRAAQAAQAAEPEVQGSEGEDLSGIPPAALAMMKKRRLLEEQGASLESL
jgi:hypothetical protein